MGFGRRRMAISAEELRDYVVYQAGALGAFAAVDGAPLQHVKPHGAMYTMIVDSPEYAEAVCAAVAALDPAVILLMPPDVAGAAAAAGVPFVPEGYVDLDYDSAGKLVLERVKQVRDPEEMGEKAVRLVRERKVRTVDGGELELEVESICVHGDAPNAPEIARAIRRALAEAGIEVAPLAGLGAAAATS
jgi:UPF0271 protein